MTDLEVLRSDTLSGSTFVVEKVAPRYDFRLELDGTELRWAVPNGPGLSPGATRLAIRIEDAADSEREVDTEREVEPTNGTRSLPVWDRGTWQTDGDVREACDKGHVRLMLFGNKLRGEWHLVRMDQGEGDNWVLFKARDEQAPDQTDGSIIDEIPDEALEGRNLDQIAETIDATACRRIAKRA